MSVIPDPTRQPFMSPDEIARATGSNVKTIHAAIRSGEIPATRIGRKVLVATAWLAARADPAPAAIGAKGRRGQTTLKRER